MLLYRKDDLCLGLLCLTNTGRKATVTDDSPEIDMVRVKFEDDGTEKDILVGEPFKAEEFPEWLREVVYPQPPCQCEECELGRQPPSERELEQAAWNSIWDGHDPATFDGDLLEIV